MQAGHQFGDAAVPRLLCNCCRQRTHCIVMHHGALLFTPTPQAYAHLHTLACWGAHTVNRARLIEYNVARKCVQHVNLTLACCALCLPLPLLHCTLWLSMGAMCIAIAALCCCFPHSGRHGRRHCSPATLSSTEVSDVTAAEDCYSCAHAKFRPIIAVHSNHLLCL